MNKINKLKFICLFIILSLYYSDNVTLFAAPQASVANKVSGITPTPPSVPTGNTGSSGSTSAGGSSGSSSGSSSSSKSGYTMKVFDPFLDNHLKAPPDGIRVGKFGQKIKEVETELRELGAKNHSYAFGKYSKMILSSYLITLSFDTNKRLGSVEVEPKPPLKTVEPKAKEFFIKYFTEGADLTQIGIVIKPEILELRFINPD